jgi:predicted N-acetyltransferase YhbS
VTAVRDAGAQEAPALGDLLSRAGFGPTVGGLVAFPADSAQGDVLVAERNGRAVGGVCCASFGPSGWIGALGVVPEARRRGVGRALAEAACDRLCERGAQTVLLFATDMGRPLYDAMGFEAEGDATAWRGTAGKPRTPLRLRSLRESDRETLIEIDHWATGERRGPVLDALRPLQGLMAERDDEPAGFALTSPWGAGVAICSREPEAGVVLLASVAAGPSPTTIVVPTDNPAASEALRHWGFTAAAAGARMRLGPPVPWRPELQFGLFNLFWG